MKVIFILVSVKIIIVNLIFCGKCKIIIWLLSWFFCNNWLVFLIVIFNLLYVNLLELLIIVRLLGVIFVYDKIIFKIFFLFIFYFIFNVFLVYLVYYYNL